MTAWSILRLAHAAMHAPAWGSQGLPPRAQARQAHRQLMFAVLTIITTGIWLVGVEAAGLMGLHGFQIAVSILVTDLILVTISSTIALTRWLRSAAGQRWQLRQELETPPAVAIGSHEPRFRRSACPEPARQAASPIYTEPPR